MVVTVANGKGGSGKTTVSVLLALAVAAAGRRVAISDRDPQATASMWLHALNDAAADRPGKKGAGVPEVLKPGERYDVVIVDTPPRIDAPAVREAVAEADKVLLIASPSPADLWATRASAEVIKSYLVKKQRARVVFNSVQPGTKLAGELENVSGRIGLDALEPVIRRRQCYQHAAVLGWPGLTVPAREEVMFLAGAVIAL